MKVPSELPRFVRTIIKNTLRNRFLKKPLKLKMSSGILFTSCTVGFLTVASHQTGQPSAGHHRVQRCKGGGDNRGKNAQRMTESQDCKQTGEEAVPQKPCRYLFQSGLNIGNKPVGNQTDNRHRNRPTDYFKYRTAFGYRRDFVDILCFYIFLP